MRARKRKESSIQEAVVKYARANGAVAIKQSAGLGMTVGWPDYLFLCDGQAEFVEFKMEGGKLTELQSKRHRQLAEVRFPPAVISDVGVGKRYLAGQFGWEKTDEPRKRRSPRR